MMYKILYVKCQYLKIWGFVIDVINIKDIWFKNISFSQLIFFEKEIEKKLLIFWLFNM